MTDTKRAILLFEYDDGTRRAFEFTELKDAFLHHTGLPGQANMHVSGMCDAIWDFTGWLANAGTAAIEEGDDNERGQ